LLRKIKKCSPPMAMIHEVDKPSRPKPPMEV